MWGKQESNWMDYKYLFEIFDGSTPCLKEAFDYYGVELKIELDYKSSIKEIQIGIYNAVWIISGHGSGTYWKCGGSLVFWWDNEPLFYETNLFLEKVNFPQKTELRFCGNHKGQKEIV